MGTGGHDCHEVPASLKPGCCAAPVGRIDAASARSFSSRRRSKLLALGLAGTIIIAALALGNLNQAGFETPAACITSYREAILAGNGDAYLQCLAEPLRASVLADNGGLQSLPKRLREQAAGIKSWVETAGTSDAATARFIIEEIRVAETSQSRVELIATPAGWKIVRIVSMLGTPMPIPYGTHVSQVPAEREP